MVSSAKHVPIVKKHKKVAIVLPRQNELKLTKFRRLGSAINPTDSSVFLQHGGSPRESTTECEDDLRVKWSCHRYGRNPSIEQIRGAHWRKDIHGLEKIRGS